MNSKSLLVIAMLSSSSLALAAPDIDGQVAKEAVKATTPAAAVETAAKAPAVVQEQATEAGKSAVTEQVKAAAPEQAKQGLKAAGNLKEKAEKAPHSLHAASAAVKSKVKEEAVTKAVGVLHQ